jgi:hypothetical protein
MIEKLSRTQPYWAVGIIPAQYEKLQYRLDEMYEDKLDGRINQDLYNRKSLEWKREQDDILRKIERLQGASRSYKNGGVKLLELSQQAVMLYEKQTAQEKRRIINFVCSNSVWKDGLLQPNYRKPFDILVENNLQFQNKWPIFRRKTTILNFGSPARTRTADKVVNSHLLYLLSYWGSVKSFSFIFLAS